MRSYEIDRRKKWQITCKGKTISKHVSFYLAQKAATRHLKSDKIDNSYKIESLPLTEAERREFGKMYHEKLKKEKKEMI